MTLWGKWKWVAAAAALLFGAETFAVVGLGLGDPPLTLMDPELEYRFKPGHYWRFGNRIDYNEYSMRSAAPRGERRVLVLGDSVVNGGAETDQSELATELLGKSLGPDSWVGNISAGSWGPANLTAYLRRYGYFDADVILLVLSTHDIDDVPTFAEDLGPGYPTERPTLAIVEAVQRLLPRHLGTTEKPQPRPKVNGERELAELIAELDSSGIPYRILVHAARDELSGLDEGGKRLRRAVGSRAFDMAPYFSPEHYRDNLHINRAGQYRLFEIMRAHLPEQPVRPARLRREGPRKRSKLAAP